MIKVEHFTFNPLAENTYVLSNEKDEALIIDPGCYFTEEERMLQEYITTKRLKPLLLLNTHCHLDHVFGNNWVYKTYGLELHLHEGEVVVLETAPASGNLYGLGFTTYKGPLHFLKEGDEIIFGDNKLKVLFTPGHSPASICFYCEAQHFIIGGDVLFQESIGRFDLPGGNEQTLYKSIREKLYVLPDETIVYPGHGEPTTIGHEKNFNPFVRP
ncbi:MBL fold metallo-hydrolase [Parafilimonas terrae]|uniref:Glyoxylase, beta-lactamase superfamily II n=1 Tax=Parafilimonas terrae TaxID=1465490 RepID=A0A1I5VVS3_9BACT|nr:MBL fold metallo-hydrolase [Parafilimonas terrae]SFQ11638.1 Glyoxylase, beta-lactamase superfamily II [Parafilimonas terrae]